MNLIYVNRDLRTRDDSRLAKLFTASPGVSLGAAAMDGVSKMTSSFFEVEIYHDEFHGGVATCIVRMLDGKSVVIQKGITADDAARYAFSAWKDSQN